jgi:hypothetical protein
LHGNNLAEKCAEVNFNLTTKAQRHEEKVRAHIRISQLQKRLTWSVALVLIGDMKKFWIGIGVGLLIGIAIHFLTPPTYRIYTGEVKMDGNSMTVFLKFDNSTGQCWKSKGFDNQWHEMTPETIMQGVTQ